MKTLIKNATIISNNQPQLVNLELVDDKIATITSINPSLTSQTFDKIIDANKQLLIPGMIDVHIHGANHFDMMDGTTESIQEVSKKCLATGTTGFLVTSVTSSLEQLLGMISATKEVIGKEKGAKILGIHLEGPYLNPVKKGMQDPNHLRLPDLEEIKEIVTFADGLIKMVTIAPELPGAHEVINYLISEGIVVAAGHTNATYEEAIEAFDMGVNHITHCCNAMPSIHHRSHGVARLKDGTLASSTVTMNKALQISTEMKLPLGDSIQMAAQTPAELLGYSHIGQIATSFDADLILLNDNFDVVMTMVKRQEIG